MTTNDKLFHSLLELRTAKTRAWQFTMYAMGGALLTLPEGHELAGFRLDCVRNVNDPESTRLGWLEYGADPTQPAYNTWIFHELGGTGTLIYAVVDGELFVGLVSQKRTAERHPVFNPNGEVLNAVRGFLDKRGDDADDASRRELYEEAGVFAGVPVDLGGQNKTANNAWFAYDDMIVRGKAMQGGARFYAVRVKPEVLVPGSQDALLRVLRNVEPEVALEMIKRGIKVLEFKPGAAKPGSPDSPYEKIKGGVTFLPAVVATGLRCGFTVAAIACLRSWLEAKGAAKVTYDLSVLDA